MTVSGCDVGSCFCKVARKRGIFGVEGLMDRGLGHPRVYACQIYCTTYSIASLYSFRDYSWFLQADLETTGDVNLDADQIQYR